MRWTPACFASRTSAAWASAERGSNVGSTTSSSAPSSALARALASPTPSAISSNPGTALRAAPAGRKRFGCESVASSLAIVWTTRPLPALRTIMAWEDLSPILAAPALPVDRGTASRRSRRRRRGACDPGGQFDAVENEWRDLVNAHELPALVRHRGERGDHEDHDAENAKNEARFHCSFLKERSGRGFAPRRPYTLPYGLNE